MIRIRPLVSFGLLAALGILPSTAHATWPRDPAQNLRLHGGSNYRNSPQLCPDGAGGAFLAWVDYANTPDCHCDIYRDVVVRHVDRDGGTHDSHLVSRGDLSSRPSIAAGGEGRAFVAWHDRGYHSDDPGIFVEHFTTEGPQWGGRGVEVTLETADIVTGPVVAGDGLGGALVAWIERRFEEHLGTTERIYVQKLDAYGTVRWREGGALVTEVEEPQSNLSLVAASDGGAILTWEQVGSTGPDVYVMKLDAWWGWPAWPVHYEESPAYDGIAVSARVSAETAPRAVSDGSGGVCIVWVDDRMGTPDVRASRFNHQGLPIWADREVVTAPGEQQDLQVISDGTGGVIVAWVDTRDGEVDLYAQRLTNIAVRAWYSEGVALCSGYGAQDNLRITSDGSGGLIASWVDQRLGSLDIWASRVSTNGAGWTNVPISVAPGGQFNPDLTSDNRGGAIIAWDDARSDYSRDIYAQRIDRSGHLGDPAPTIVTLEDMPNDEGGRLRLRWDASYLDADPDYLVSAYWIWRVVPAAVALARTSPAHRDEITSTSAPALGTIVAETATTGTVYWELVAQQPAAADPGYGVLVATTSDGPTPTTVRVQARHRDGYGFWNSGNAIAQSFDNLAPATPQGFTASVGSGVLRLHWQRSNANDLAGYRIYRGTTPDFAPTLESLIASPADTGHVVPIGYHVYKLAAVDDDGNESPCATLSTTPLVDVASTTTGALHVTAFPNPSPGALRIEWSLPRTADVRVEILDVTGRRVRDLGAGAFSEGRHDLTWRGDDASGHPVANGIYYARVRAGGSEHVRRIVIAR